MKDIPKLTDAARAAEPEVAEVKQIAEAISSLEIVSNRGLENAVGAIADIKDKAREVDEKRKKFVKPLKSVIKDIDYFFKPALDGLKKAEALLKSKVSDYTVATAESRDRVLAEVGQSDDAEQKTALMKKADDLETPKVAGMSVRESWSGEVTDADALKKWIIAEDLVRELLLVNEKALLDMTRKDKRDPHIPGWRAFVKRSVAITTSKIKR